MCLVWSTLLKLSTFFILLPATSLFTQQVWSRHVSTVCLVCVNFGGYEFISFFVWQWTKFGVFFFLEIVELWVVFVSLSVLEISPKRIFFFKFDTFPPQVRKSDRATCSLYIRNVFLLHFCVCVFDCLFFPIWNGVCCAEWYTNGLISIWGRPLATTAAA